MRKLRCWFFGCRLKSTHKTRSGMDLIIHGYCRCCGKSMSVKWMSEYFWGVSEEIR